jgi:hypothetical protein
MNSFLLAEMHIQHFQRGPMKLNLKLLKLEIVHGGKRVGPE